MLMFIFSKSIFFYIVKQNLLFKNFILFYDKTILMFSLLDAGYGDRGPQGGSRQSNDRWDSRSNRGNYGQFNDDTGGNREWSRSASSRSYSNKPPLRTGPDRKPFPDDSYQKDAPLPGV